MDNLAGQQASIKYDDVPPFLDVRSEADAVLQLRSAPIGRRPRVRTLALVLPGTDTSCIVTGAQTVLTSGNLVHVQYQVYTAYDGGRQIPGAS